MRAITTCIVLIFLSISATSYGQALKWGFEDWEWVDGIESPTGWNVNDFSTGIDTVIGRFYKDSIHVVEGKYSLMAIKDEVITSAFFDCRSTANLYQDLEASLPSGQSIYFSVKTESLTEWDESYVDITVGFSKDDVYLGRVEWLSYDVIEEFTQIELPILFENVDAISIWINAASQNGALDGCNAQSIVWLDDIKIEQSTAVDVVDLSLEEIIASPNPTDGIISLSSQKLNGNKFVIKDIVGREIQRGTVKHKQIILSHNGLNVIHVERNESEPVILKIVKVE